MDPESPTPSNGGRTSRIVREVLASMRADEDDETKPIDIVREEHRTRRQAMRLLTLLLLVTLIGVFGYVGVPLLIDVPGLLRAAVSDGSQDDQPEDAAREDENENADD